MSKASNRNRPVDYFMLQEPKGEGLLVGHFAGAPIPERMTDCFGLRYRFAGIASRLTDGRYDLDALRPGEWLVEPGLIYVQETGLRGRRCK